MQEYGVNIVVEGGELEKILARLSAAQEEIQQCYFELERLGVLVIKKQGGGIENFKREIENDQNEKNGPYV